MNALQQLFGLRWRDAARLVVVAATILVSGNVAAQSVVIYDDALENDFSTGYSYNGGLVVGSTAQAHTGTNSISLTGNGTFNALSFTGSSTYPSSTYPVFHFWIYGSAPGGQNLYVEVRPNRDSDTVVASAPLDGYISGGSVGSGVWREVTVDVTQPPLSYSGVIDRIDIQTEATQTAVYIDDVSLQSSVVDEIFSASFEGGIVTPPPSNGLVDDQDIAYDTITSDRFTWYDSANKKRIAVLAHDDAQSFAGSHGGELRDFIYQVGATPREIAAPARGDGGFGYIVSHPGDESHCVGGDSSQLGHEIAGTWTRVFVGRHHAIFRFQQNYPRYCSAVMPTMIRNIPVTIDWTFSTGRDNPLWSVTYDMSAIGAGVIRDDSRAPYGTMNIDGSSGMYMDNDVAGIRWGDRYQFVTTNSPATLSNAWTYTTANTIPFTELWTVNVDATMGLVQSQTMTQQDAGGGRLPYGPGTYDVSAYWAKTSAAGPACPDGSDDGGQTGAAHSLPCVQYFPYQMNGFSYGPTITDSVNDAKMTWGTQYGFLGQTAYQLYDRTLPANSTAPGYPLKSYSVSVVFGQKSMSPVDAEIARSTALANVSLSTTVGSVATSGPGGVNRIPSASDPAITYSPAGYDPVYSALVFNASSNKIDATIGVGSGTLKKPLIIIRNYTSGAYPTTVQFGGSTLTMDSDYFPSLRSDKSELWITLNKNVTGASNRLQITP